MYNRLVPFPYDSIGVMHCPLRSLRLETFRIRGRIYYVRCFSQWQPFPLETNKHRVSMQPAAG